MIDVKKKSVLVKLRFDFLVFRFQRRPYQDGLRFFLDFLCLGSESQHLKIDSYFARGLAMGTSSHAMGTAESMKTNELQGAMSSIAMVVSGIVIAILVPIVAGFL